MCFSESPNFSLNKRYRWKNLIVLGAQSLPLYCIVIVLSCSNGRSSGSLNFYFINFFTCMGKKSEKLRWFFRDLFYFSQPLWHKIYSSALHYTPTTKVHLGAKVNCSHGLIMDSATMISRVVRLTKACDFCGFCGKISYFFLQTIYKLVPKTKYKINKSETISCVMAKVEMDIYLV